MPLLGSFPCFAYKWNQNVPLLLLLSFIFWYYFRTKSGVLLFNISLCVIIIYLLVCLSSVRNHLLTSAYPLPGTRKAYQLTLY